jgi:hypothetical protein
MGEGINDRRLWLDKSWKALDLGLILELQERKKKRKRIASSFLPLEMADGT